MNKKALERALESCEGTLESFINMYLCMNAKEFDAIRIYELMKLLQPFLEYRLEQQQNVITDARQSVSMLSMYLRGDMYNTQEATLSHMSLQAENCEKLETKLKEVF